MQKSRNHSGSLGPIVTTNDGQKLQGRLIKLDDQKQQKKPQEICEFIEVPYAQPPVGPLRFKPPVSLNHASSICSDGPILVRQCTERTRVPHQTDLSEFAHFFKLHKKKQPFSEDCLYLNIWTPSDTLNAAVVNTSKHSSTSTGSSSTVLLPVCVYLHGGGFVAGAAHDEFYNGKRLAAFHRIVVVNVSYRLGALGHLYLPGADICGNQSLLDQRLALNWIHQNIERFGGRADQVTLAGFSSGAASVGLHMMWRREASQRFLSIAEPTKSTGERLFHRAIMQSGSPLAPWVLGGTEHVLHRRSKLVAELLRKFTSDETQSLNTTTDATDEDDAQFLRAVPAEAFSDLQLAGQIVEGSYNMQWSPVWRDDFFILSSSSIPKIPLMMGTVDNEVGFLAFSPIPDWLLAKNRVDWPSSEQIDWHTIFSQCLTHLPHYPHEVSEATLHTIKQRYEGIACVESLYRCMSDVQFVKPALDFIRRFYSDSAGAPVFVYKFFKCGTHGYLFSEEKNDIDSNDELKSVDNLVPDWIGTNHSEDLHCIFGWPRCKNAESHAKAYCSRVMTMYARFIACEDISTFSTELKWTEFSMNEFGPILQLTPNENSSFLLHWMNDEEKDRYEMWKKLTDEITKSY